MLTFYDKCACDRPIDMVDMCVFIKSNHFTRIFKLIMNNYSGTQNNEEKMDTKTCIEHSLHK